jgi:membrane-bound lytic murein transglycosylase A
MARARSPGKSLRIAGTEKGAAARARPGLIAFAVVMAAALTVTTAFARGKTVKLRNAEVTDVGFDALAGWKDDDQAEAFGAFLKSCTGAILNSTPKLRKGRPLYAGLYHVCKRAAAAGPLDREQARRFFEDNFKAVRIAPSGQDEGFFTGYYEPIVEGSRFPSDKYKVPLYRIPEKFIGQSKVFPQLDRTEIEDGALAGKGLEICWVENPVDAFFAQIQGSTRVRLDTGKMLRLNYIASNGHPYTPVGRFLIDQGIVTREDMSMDKIRQFMESNPDEGKELRRKNKSFVFFTETSLKEHEECIGAQGVPLTPLRSLAVDKKMHVYGTPIWVDAKLPIASEAPETPFRKLLIAQDTGSAIVGPARADIYFGAGHDVASIAGRIKQPGQFVMLVPRAVPVKGETEIVLPRPRPKITDEAAAKRRH